MFSVIFDMDGTLLDTQRICIPAWEWAGRNQGIEGVGKDIQFVCGMNSIGWSAYLKEHYPEMDLERFMREMRQYIIDNMTVRFREGGQELLEYLRGRGVKIGLASGSSRATVNHHLEAVGAMDYFYVTVAGDEVERGKPEPDVFLITAEKMGAEPQDCYVFEDSVNGIRAAISAGMKCIGFPDIVDFSEEISSMLETKVLNLADAIDIFENY